MYVSRTAELWVGVFVLAGVAALFALAMKVSNISAFQNTNGYEVVARFENIGGLNERAPVTLGGVQIGRVKRITLDQQSFQARVVLSISRDYDNLPEDSSASILTAGLLGEQYVGLEPGGMEATLSDGDEIMLTQSALVLEKIISQFLYRSASE
jgi:phospholipid/cholesterol/gamma-HCH transport system substrate-binding protein